MTAVEFSNQVQKASVSLRPMAFNLTRDSDDAKDLVQETVLKALSNRTKFRPGTNLKAWLYTIMRNTFINNYNKVTKRNIPLDTSDHVVLPTSDRSFVTQNAASGTFVMTDIVQAIDKVQEEYRTPFMMYYIGYKYLEIADKLQIPIGTVKNRIHMARKELKAMLSVYAYGRD